MAKPPRKPKAKAAPKAAFKGIGGGKYKVTDRKSANFGKTFTKDQAGNHVYKLAGGKTRTVGKRTVPFDPAAPIATQQDFNQRVSSATNLRFGDQQTELDSQKRINAQDATNRNQWFQDYQQAIAQATQRQQAANQQAQQAIYAQANQQAAGTNAQSGQMDQAAQAAAAIRGTTAAPSAAPQAAAANQALSSSFGGQVAAQGLAQTGYSHARFGAAAGMRATALSQAAGNQRKLSESQQKLNAQKGDFATDYGTKLRQQEFTNQLGLKTLLGNQQDDAADNQLAQFKTITDARDKAATRRQNASDKRADRRVRLQGQETTRRGQDLSHSDRQAAIRARKNGNGRGGKGPTAKQTEGYQSQYQQVAGRARGRRLKSSYNAEVQQAIDAGIPPDLAKAAIQRGRNGGVEKKLAARVYKKYGFKVKVGGHRPLNRVESLKSGKGFG